MGDASTITAGLFLRTLLIYSPQISTVRAIPSRRRRCIALPRQRLHRSFGLRLRTRRDRFRRKDRRVETVDRISRAWPSLTHQFRLGVGQRWKPGDSARGNPLASSLAELELPDETFRCSALAMRITRLHPALMNIPCLPLECSLAVRYAQ